jgi:hypothetical protein
MKNIFPVCVISLLCTIALFSCTRSSSGSGSSPSGTYECVCNINLYGIVKSNDTVFSVTETESIAQATCDSNQSTLIRGGATGSCTLY